MPTPREIALQTLLPWKKLYDPPFLPERSEEGWKTLSPRDRAFAFDLLTGVMRWRGTLDAVIQYPLRQPLESGAVTIHRAGGAATYPARFQLVLAANPCPCARGGKSTDAASCRCTSVQLRTYKNRISGPLLDRIDLLARLTPVSRAVLAAGATGEPTANVRARVLEARARAVRRLGSTPWGTNAAVPGPELRRNWPIPSDALVSLSADLDRQRLSTRGVDRVMKVAWTLADLAGRDLPIRDDVERARALRAMGSTPELARTA